MSTVIMITGPPPAHHINQADGGEHRQTLAPPSWPHRQLSRKANNMTTVTLPHTGAPENNQFKPPAPKLAGDQSDRPAILALDLGSRTGWAMRTMSGQVVSGTHDFRPRRFEGGGMRYLRFHNWLIETRHLADPIDAIYFEEVRRHAGTDAAHVFGGFLATLTAWAEHYEIPYEGVPVGTIKRHVTGKGNASKQAVIAAIKARGFNPVDDNEADAIAILSWAIETKGGVL